MTVAFALALLAQQGAAPTLPPGTSIAFAQTALAVEARLVAGDVPGARKVAQGLPVRTPRFVFVDDALPPDLKAARQAAVERVFATWGRGVPGFAPKESADAPDLKIDFAKVLPDGPGEIPLATEVVPGPPFRATIGLTRGKPGVPLRREEMTQEIAYAVGRYLGVNESPFPSSGMHRDARPNLISVMPQRLDAIVAAGNLELADQLRAGIEAGKPIGLTSPAISLDKSKLDLGSVLQGDPLRSFIEVRNTGLGPLSYDLVPDCSCFSKPPPGRVPPGGRARIPILVNTLESLGRQDKTLLLLTNDPARPSIQIPVTFHSRPAYRIFRPGGDRVVVPDAGGAFDVFFFTDSSQPIHPVSASWKGIPAKIDWAPWSGSLADPEMGEDAIPRKGWRFRVRISRIPAGFSNGQTPGTLTLVTDSPIYRNVRYSLYAQSGILAEPNDVYLSDMEAGTRATLRLSRPNGPFKILSVDAGPLKGTWRDIRGGWEYSVDLEYSGGAPKGDFLTPIKIRTDDPKQPLIEVLARGTVK